MEARGSAGGKMLCEKSHLEYRNNDIKLSHSFYLNWFRVLVQQSETSLVVKAPAGWFCRREKVIKLSRFLLKG
jgi:hypothetical protein